MDERNRRSVRKRILFPALVLIVMALNGRGAEIVISDPPAIKKVQDDITTYRTRCKEFTVLYWVLTALAAGSAISTAIRTGYARHTAHPATGAAADSPTPADKWILGLSIATVLATTLLTAIQPQQTASRYCFGQLLLEKAIVRYEGVIGRSKTQADVDAVTGAYSQAEDVLRDGTEELAQKVSEAPKKAAAQDVGK